MKCEAPSYCKREGNTKDHFSPQSILKELGFTKKYIDRPENIQMLCWPHHAQKDAITPWELEAVKRNGGAKTIWQHHNEQIILRKGNPLMGIK